MIDRDQFTRLEAKLNALREAYHYFNQELWQDFLPDVPIVLEQRPNAQFDLNVGAFVQVDDEVGPFQKPIVKKFAMNPDFSGRSGRAIFAAMVHEMTHVWQVFYWSYPVPCHNQEWATEMKRIGLFPSDTGALGGKETGWSVGHVIDARGLFCSLF